MDLESLRKEIDAIDDIVLALLDERLGKALMTRRFKAGALDAEREGRVVARIGAMARGLLDPGLAEALYRAIIEKGRSLQEGNPATVGFTGGRGSPGEAVAGDWLPGAAVIAFENIAKLADAVESGGLDYGLFSPGPEGMDELTRASVSEGKLRIVATIDGPTGVFLVVGKGSGLAAAKSG